MEGGGEQVETAREAMSDLPVTDGGNDQELIKQKVLDDTNRM